MLKAIIFSTTFKSVSKNTPTFLMFWSSSFKNTDQNSVFARVPTSVEKMFGFLYFCSPQETFSD